MLRVILLSVLVAFFSTTAIAEETVLFDFEDDAALEAWTVLRGPHTPEIC